MQLGAGTTLQKGKYLLNHVLNQQGSGWTYRATHPQSNQSVVIKVLNPAFRSHPEYRRICEEFEGRSHQWAKSRHPGLVKVLDFFYEEAMPQAMPFVVMESVVGMSLGDRLRSETLSEANIILFLRQISSALTQAQEQGLVHGNVRPQNIIHRSGSQDCVLVGSAASLMPSLFERSTLQNPYAAPELSYGKVTSSADLYSLGAILYTCLSGHSPTLAMNDALLTDRLPLLSLLKPGAIRLLRSAMASAPNERPATADDWLALLASRSAATAPVSAPPPVTRMAPFVVAPFVSSIVPPIAAPIAVPIALPAFQTQPNPTQPPSQVQPIQRAKSPPTLSTRPPQHPTFNIQHSTFRTRLPSARSFKQTAGIAAIGGILFGLVLRFHAAQRPGASFFHTEQSFPAREWKGTPDPSKDNLDDGRIEAPRSARPNSSRSTKPNSAMTSTSENPSEKSPDNSVNLATPPSIAPFRSRRTDLPSEFPQDPGSRDFASTSPLEKPDRSTVPDFPLQRDLDPVTAPSTAPPASSPDFIPAPESSLAPRSTLRPNRTP